MSIAISEKQKIVEQSVFLSFLSKKSYFPVIKKEPIIFVFFAIKIGPFIFKIKKFYIKIQTIFSII